MKKVIFINLCLFILIGLGSGPACKSSYTTWFDSDGDKTANCGEFSRDDVLNKEIDLDYCLTTQGYYYDWNKGGEEIGCAIYTPEGMFVETVEAEYCKTSANFSYKWYRDDSEDKFEVKCAKYNRNDELVSNVENSVCETVLGYCFNIEIRENCSGEREECFKYSLGGMILDKAPAESCVNERICEFQHTVVCD